MNTNKPLLGAGLLAAALLLFWVFDAAAYQRVSALKSAIAERRQVLADRRSILADVSRLHQQYQQHAGEIAKFSAIIPTKKDIAEMVSSLDAIATQSGLQISEISTGESLQAKESYLPLLLTIKAKGNYNGLVNFLDGVERNIRLVNVDTLEVARDENQPSVLNMTIKGNAYFLK